MIFTYGKITKLNSWVVWKHLTDVANLETQNNISLAGDKSCRVIGFLLACFCS